MPPHNCLLCRAASRRALCAPCAQDIARLRAKSRCEKCAIPAAAALCGECLRRPPHYDRTFAAHTYAPPLSALIQDFKFNGKWQLAKLLAEAASVPKADALIPVPLFFAREQWRGFNQSREIARALPPPRPPRQDLWLRRIADTPPQTRMPNAAARRKNVRGAFVADAKVRDKIILVVDDVMTSGATLNEIARTLKQAGAKEVFNLVAARAAPD